MANAGLVNYLADVFAKSGGIGWITMLLLFICLGLALERLVFWGRLWGLPALLGAASPKRMQESVADVERLVRMGRHSEASTVARQSPHPAMRILGLALARLRHSGAWVNTRDQVIAETLGCNITMGRRLLIMSIQTFGLLGMLGTCKGLYAQLSGFSAVTAGAAGVQSAMGGMGEAFTTTLVGLAAAGLVTLLYLPNEVAIETLERQLKGYDARIQAALQEGAGVSAPVRPAATNMVATMRRTSGEHAKK